MTQADTAILSAAVAAGRPALVSFDLCPYVQRASIVLAEKGIAFERIDIDLANKPAWFLELSPLGKVPLLQVGRDVLFESASIVEYLDEVHGPALHPADPLAKAQHRAWMEVGSSILGDIWVLETTQRQADFDAKVASLKAKFARIEAALGKGPWFEGTRFSIVDAVFGPVFRYFDTFDRIVSLGVFDDLPKVRAWRAALAARPSIRNAVRSDYGDRLQAFLKAQGGVMAARMR